MTMKNISTSGGLNMWDLMHKCCELYSQINPFVVLNLLNVMITNSKFINFAFF